MWLHSGQRAHLPRVERPSVPFHGRRIYPRIIVTLTQHYRAAYPLLSNVVCCPFHFETELSRRRLHFVWYSTVIKACPVNGTLAWKHGFWNISQHYQGVLSYGTDLGDGTSIPSVLPSFDKIPATGWLRSSASYGALIHEKFWPSRHMKKIC